MSWIQTYSGRPFNLLNLNPDTIHINDIAHALGNTCRFAGHCVEFYSVAQHSVHVSQLVPREHALVALLHDAAEAYLTDIPSPFKPLLPDYVAVESYVWQVIVDKYGLPYALPEEVKHADRVALATERRDLLAPTSDVWPILEGIEPDEKIITDRWSPHRAGTEFLRRYYQLTRNDADAA